MKDLQSRIDKIIEEERQSSSGVVGDFAVAVQHGMWRCGLEVLKDYPEYENFDSERGGRGLRIKAWSKLSHEIGRTDKTIKAWVDLVIRVGKTKSDWEGYAEKARVAAINKWLNGMARKELPAEIDDVSQEHDPWLYNEDFSEVVPEEPIDLILTDPPYGIEFEEQWTKLAVWAKKYLKPNGFLVSYFGELNLPSFYAALSSQLGYYWTFCLVHRGNKQLIMPRNVFCGWKPILVYQNGFKRLRAQVDDIIEGSGREKDDHEWQQGESELEPLLNYFSRPGFIVCDPFMGSGTTLVKAAKMKRRIMGMEIDPDTFKTAVRKING